MLRCWSNETDAVNRFVNRARLENVRANHKVLTTDVFTQIVVLLLDISDAYHLSSSVALFSGDVFSEKSQKMEYEKVNRPMPLMR
jgi:hypothetical protein